MSKINIVSKSLKEAIRKDQLLCIYKLENFTPHHQWRWKIRVPGDLTYAKRFLIYKWSLFVFFLLHVYLTEEAKPMDPPHRTYGSSSTELLTSSMKAPSLSHKTSLKTSPLNTVTWERNLPAVNWEGHMHSVHRRVELL